MNQEYWSKQVCLVTGSGRGIGREIAIHLSKLGAKVAINYNSNEAKAKEVLDLCHPERTRMYKANVGDPKEVQDMVKRISEDLGSVSVLINNAGHTLDKLFLTMSFEEWRSVMSVHLDGTFLVTKACIEGMLKSRYGRIINISSVSGIKGTAGQTNYSAAKSGVIGLTKALSREVGKRNITVNAIALGAIETDMTNILPDDVKDAYRKQTSLKRFGKTEDVSPLVEYLSGPNSSYVTGEVIVMDGGLT